MPLATASDGVRIAYETAGAGEPAIVFVHGWSCDRSYWQHQIGEFARSHRVVALDLAGHGESGLGRGDWSIAAFAGDVRAVIEALGLNRLVLVGHSLGGPVIVETARLIPDRVVGLIPVDFFGDVDRRMNEDEIEREAASLRGDFRAAAEAKVRMYFPAGADPQLVDRIAADMAAGPPGVAISALQHARRYEQGPALGAVRAPIRLINADFWPTDLAAVRRYNPAVGLAVVHGAGHFVMLEKPEEFNRLLRGAVNELVG